MRKLKSDCVGLKFKTNNSGYCTIIEYLNYKNVIVEFDDGMIIKCEMGQLKKGTVKNKNNTKVYGVGFNDLKKELDLSGHSKEYLLWRSMLSRCFSKSYHEKQPTYKDVRCDESWHTASNFIKDISKLPNYDKIFNDGWHMDKDILSIDGKVYNKDCVCFVPQEINNLLTLRANDRGLCKLGVTYRNDINKYCAAISIDSIKLFLGFFETENEAFSKYKESKEQAIKDKAIQYKHLLPDNVYNTLINYEIK